MVDQNSSFCYTNGIVTKQEPKMQLATAIKHLQKEAEFLGLPLLETLAFIQKNPLAQPMKTLEAYRVFTAEGARMFAPVDQ